VVHRHRRHAWQDHDDLARRRAARGGGLDPTVINGGIINAYGTNARMGKGDWMVVEADESDGTFLKLPADVAIVTNIDPEHLDHYGTFDAIKEGLPRLRREHALLRLRRDVHRSSGGAGSDRAGRGPARHHLWRNPQADVRLMDVDLPAASRAFRVMIHDRRTGETHRDPDLVMPMPGDHNALNSTAALAVAPMNWACRMMRSARARGFPASSGASRARANGTASGLRRLRASSG
jgi:UDP-N-acetylmuramate--alanine ligase